LVRFSSRLLASLTLLTTTIAAFAAAPLEYNNPLVLQRADPHVQRHGDGRYYMAATVPAYDRIEIRRSRSIQGLGGGEVKTIWHKHDTGTPPDRRRVVRLLRRRAGGGDLGHPHLGAEQRLGRPVRG
jgi:hypothetical protein